MGVASFGLDELKPSLVDNRLIVVDLIRPLNDLKPLPRDWKPTHLNTT